ncbi:ubiquitin-like conjugating enzyme [Atractiella rhizophila]|nr:ubiquitin-like conjugating enzyme [Atractiella rhizophila]
MSNKRQILTFDPFASSVPPTFWHSLTKYKIDHLKLSDATFSVIGSYSRGTFVHDRQTGGDIGMASTFNLEKIAGADDSATEATSNREQIVVEGTAKNFNTIEEFKSSNKSALFDEHSQQLWTDLTATTPTEESLRKLVSFFLITFADLKKYRYFYWFAFPAFLAKPPWEIDGEFSILSQTEATVLRDSYISFSSNSTSPTPFWLLTPSMSDSTIFEVSSILSLASSPPVQPLTIAFLDPSTSSSPGWPLRNLLTFLAHHYPTLVSQQITVYALRDPLQGPIQTVRSRKCTIILPITEKVEGRPSAVGWEKNAQGKMIPKVADLGPLMDPSRLADQAVDLNLKLMRWRILPSLDLDKVKDTKCLLLGAGTLGCYVSRTLMAWGVRKITLLDSAKVSFSNPVRQPLFEFSDCLDGGKPKAECAAAALKKIYPNVDATGVSLSIPMPGHPVPTALIEQTKEDVAELERLFDAHDVIYLLMDSRESRWLPTMMGKLKGKLVMNAALGFDSYVVGRHGMRARPSVPDEKPLGCYFCNDVVAPADSLSDRTLDQMCTVTRPGLAAIASATAVELMVSTLQHADGPYAQSEIVYPGEEKKSMTESVLGEVPHQIRGYLAQFNNLKITGRAYDRCTACSDYVLKAYEEKGWEMLEKAFGENEYLEKLTGLDELKKESEKVLEEMEEWDEEEE